MRKREFIVYGLRDPRDGAIRYVGKSTFGISRAKQHAMPCELKRRRSRKSKWVEELEAIGLHYEIVVLERLDSGDVLYAAEQRWIAEGRQAGTLLNLSDGGPGSYGCKFSDESCARMSAVRIGKKFSPEHRAKLSEAARNRSPEHRRKLGEKLKGRTLSEETKRKIAEAGRGRHQSSETRAKQSETMKKTIKEKGSWLLGTKHSDATKEQMSKSACGRSEITSERTKALWRDPKWSDDVRRKISERAKERWSDPEWRRTRWSKRTPNSDKT